MMLNDNLNNVKDRTNKNIDEDEIIKKYINDIENLTNIRYQMQKNS